MKQRTFRHLIRCAALAAALLLPAVARAEAESPKGAAAGSVSAAEHARRAQVAYDLADWTTAIKEYEAAYRIDQDAQYLWGLAQAQRLGARHADAIKSYKAFQRANVSSSQANAAEMMITKCEAEIATEEATKAVGESKKHEEREPTAPPAPTPAPERDAPKATGGLGVGWFIAGAVLTAGLGAAATWSGLDTNSKAKSYEQNPTREGYLDGKDLETRTNLLVGATAVAGVSTIVIGVFTNWSGSRGSRHERAARFRVQPALGARSGTLIVNGAF